MDLKDRLQSARLSSVILDHDKRVVTTLNPSRILWRPLKEIPLPLQHAIVAVEDSRFYQHRGIDIRGILRALVENFRQGERVQGGSTITQQLAKNLLLTQERTFRRKLAEIGYAVRIEGQFTKDQILEFYLNDIYFGRGVYGVEAAARTYFGRSVQELSLEQMALLAGLPKGPEFYSPFSHPKRALDRRNTVLVIMAKKGLITTALQEELMTRPLGTLQRPGVPTRGSYFADYVTEYLQEEFGWSERYIRDGGLRIFTPLDLTIQQRVEEVVNRLPEDGEEEQKPQIAMVVLDNKTGEILAMIGGRSYRRSPLNRATTIRRQPGSAIKPIVFAAALMEGYQSDTLVQDEPVVYSINNEPWQPQNYDNKYRGPISLTTAIEESVNTVAVKLVADIGIDKVSNLAQQMGLPLVEKGDRNDLGLAPLALGGLTRGVTPLELATAYTSMANKGIRSDPVAVIRVEDKYGRLLRRGRSRQSRVLPEKVALTLTRMMENVLTKGTGVRGYPGRPAAGKTGTTSGNTNAWFVGYTPEILAAIWLGNDDHSPLKIGTQTIGSSYAAELWGDFIRRTLADQPIKSFM
jgi:penicillin-binding protein 1A